MIAIDGVIETMSSQVEISIDLIIIAQEETTAKATDPPVDSSLKTNILVYYIIYIVYILVSCI